MRNHPTTAARADIGRTPQLCQDALIEMLKELFAGKLFCGQEGRKALKIYKQDLPIPQSDDADVDTDKAEAPYIVVRMTGGQIEDDDSPQTVDFSLIVCAYDTGLDREGWQDVANIKEDIIQRVCKAPYFGGAFTVLKPITWALQEDDTHPYYFGACTLTCTAPAMTQDTAHHALLTGGQPGAFAVSPEFTGTLPVPATVGYSVCGALRSGGVATGYTASPEFAGTLPEEAQHGN